MKTSHHNSVTM